MPWSNNKGEQGKITQVSPYWFYIKAFGCLKNLQLQIINSKFGFAFENRRKQRLMGNLLWYNDKKEKRKPRPHCSTTYANSLGLAKPRHISRCFSLQKTKYLPTHAKLFWQVYLYFCNMADVHDIKTRSYNMSRIRAKDTKPEILVRKFLFGKGFRFRLHSKNLPGKPDIVLPKYKTVVFVHGCFWHGHEGCKYLVIPKTRTSWWLNKLCIKQTKKW